ncbi:hypothetical protein [Olleya sp. HaHaR_3_96]|uniref:hypothetical protein n=1 Tax=Olleya sp. HaHaR_3_96 TaxID=2745560 RepID=UPI001C4EDD6C|nr:hypothetical protein [Olleya sp. HaHaR_3_96]QXP58411.1 hypothetical protein H0I26_10815 [Olleya sp. HaHaR_3_96]
MKNIRTSKFSKILASYLAIQLLITTIQPTNLYALTSGPSQPEFNSFTPIGTSDMVNLSSGDFNYNIPIMDVGGYPLNLAYNSGVTMDQEASWVGLGWNLNVGQINRQVRGIPDDFKGDEITYEKNLKKHVTVNVNLEAGVQVVGFEAPDFEGNGGSTGIKVDAGLGITHSNYYGVSFKPSYGLAFQLSNQVSVGVDVSTSTTEGVTVSPNVGISASAKTKGALAIGGNLNAGLSYNSSRGLGTFNLQASTSASFKKAPFISKDGTNSSGVSHGYSATSGRISFSDPFTITPRKRLAFKNNSSTFSFSVGPDLWGLDGELGVAATATKQELKDKIKTEKAYGYEFTGQASSSDVLDYNRENDRVISKYILALPTTNYTYDVYSVNGQGIGGMFRPHRSQIGQIYDEFVQDQGESYSLGGEFEGGTGWHVGGNFISAPSSSHTGVWNTTASNTFKNENENVINNDYEPVYFKHIGNNGVDQNSALYTADLNGDAAMTLALEGNNAVNKFRVKKYNPTTNVPYYETSSFSDAFRRSNRKVRNQSIQKISKKELQDFYKQEYAHYRTNNYAKDHHTAEIRILKPDGSTYVFGETVYNIEKNEVAFNTEASGDCATGLVTYNRGTETYPESNIYENGENTISNSSGIDHFYDKVKTPEYAHTYLLSSVFSSDYEDLTGNGPTDDDLGAYTTFEYNNDMPVYNWRVPYGKNQASFNASLNTNKDDQKGSYIYGKKEIKYIDKIITKTHIAVFDLSARKDARGSKNENGDLPSQGEQVMYKLDKVRLYSKPEYKKYEEELEDNDPSNDPTMEQLSPIKTAHFVYDYSLCKDLDNNLDSNYQDSGKLTLKEVYFTYRKSNMGKYTPYNFVYERDLDNDGSISEEESKVSNPDFSLKAFDLWGNYKPNNGGCNADAGLTNQEFPYVDQNDRETQDQYASAWTMRSINLPSGGSIDIEYESDDYQYVQDKHTMQMFKVVGAGSFPDESTNPEGNQKLYNTLLPESDATHLYVELQDETISDMPSESEFVEKYLKGIENKPMYFRFLMNMTKKGAKLKSMSDFDYVTGYFQLGSDYKVFGKNDKVYAAIPMKHTNMEGGLILPGEDVNPITKAGLYFGRKYLNSLVYGLNQNVETEDVVTIAKSLIKSVQAGAQIFTGPNRVLRTPEYQCAQLFIPEKSWIRLTTPKKYKLGGGIRVKKIEMQDNWDTMVSTSGQLQTYGQVYDYSLGNSQGTSGVATFEPNNSAENPFVEPFYDKPEKLVAPREVSYVEKPFGKAFFPSSTVTYSKVTVKNLERDDIIKHATGKVVSEFFTSKDFPTKVDYTDLDRLYQSNENNVLQQIIGGTFGLPINIKNEFTLSQGFVVHTNDMNGKSKSQKVYQEGADDPISTVEYIFNTLEGDASTLNNKVTVINTNGIIDNSKELGVDYDVVTDFRESYSNSRTAGISANVVAWVPGVVVPTAFPSMSSITNIGHSTITTKVLHTTAILKGKIATDLGAKVTTINQAWDATNGEVIVTKTQNEFDDAYYNFNFPAYWAHNEMGQASKNLGLRGTLISSGDYFHLENAPDASKYLALGDEIIADYGAVSPERLWIAEFNNSKTGVLLMNREGVVVNKTSISGNNFIIDQNINFKIIRSGYRNQQIANMASVTMMKNPIQNNDGSYVHSIGTNTFSQLESINTENSSRIVNASAVSYTDFWNCQCEYGLESLPYADPNNNNISNQLADTAIEDYGFNPYVHNVKGTWRANKSYAFLTERTNIKEGASFKENTRKEGYYKKFTPYYKNNDGVWEKNVDNITEDVDDWTFASEVTQYSAFGPEIENRDALNRYSSAQYGYNLTLPTAVASNSKYRHMGAENFEDYDYIRSNDAHFSYKEVALEDGDGLITPTTKYSHTGNVSLQVPFGVTESSTANLPIELLGFLPPALDTDGDGINDDIDNCPETPNRDQYNYDGDALGNACDDEGEPLRTSWAATPRMDYECRKQAIATIDGTPNSSVTYQVFILDTPRGGWHAQINGSSSLTGELYFDATGKAYIQLELAAQRKKKKKNRSRTLKVKVVIKDLHGESFDTFVFHTTSYEASDCHGEPYTAHKLFN